MRTWNQVCTVTDKACTGGMIEQGVSSRDSAMLLDVVCKTLSAVKDDDVADYNILTARNIIHDWRETVDILLQCFPLLKLRALGGCGH